MLLHGGNLTKLTLFILDKLYQFLNVLPRGSVKAITYCFSVTRGGNCRPLKKTLQTYVGRFPLTRSERSNSWMEHKHLVFGPIWPENLDNIWMRSIFARYLRNIDQIFPLIQRKTIWVWPVRPLNGKRPQYRVKLERLFSHLPCFLQRYCLKNFSCDNIPLINWSKNIMLRRWKKWLVEFKIKSYPMTYYIHEIF